MKTRMFVLGVLLLAGCDVFENDAQRSVAHGYVVPAAYTSADVRIVTNRYRPGTNTQIVCAEPSADVAKAVATAFQAAGKGGNGTVNIEVGIGGGSSEAVAELAGRSTALLGLRDGLYRACEAYANGAIGDDAYALILSRYGQLMTTLFLGQDIAGYIGGGQNKATANAPTVNINYPDSGGSSTTTGAATDTSGNTSGKTGSKGNTGSSTPPEQGATSPVSDAAAGAGAADPQNLRTMQLAAAGGGDGASSPGGAAPPADAGGPPPAALAGGPVQPDAAKIIGQMNRDYFNLDLNELHLLLVACVNENDNTRYARWALLNAQAYAPGSGYPLGPQPTTNRFVQRLCDQLTLGDIERLAQRAAKYQLQVAQLLAGVPVAKQVTVRKKASVKRRRPAAVGCAAGCPPVSVPAPGPGVPAGSPVQGANPPSQPTGH